jgi:hypothetical protein
MTQENLKQLGVAISAAMRSIDKATFSAEEIMAQTFPHQPKGKPDAERYYAIQDAAREDYVDKRRAELVKSGGAWDKETETLAKKAFSTKWSRLIGKLGYDAIKPDGSVSTQGKGGGKPKGEKPEKETPATRPMVMADHVAALFGHCDDKLIECVAFAVSHEVSFVAWAQAQAAAGAAVEKPLSKKAK